MDAVTLHKKQGDDIYDIQNDQVRGVRWTKGEGGRKQNCVALWAVVQMLYFVLVYVFMTFIIVINKFLANSNLQNQRLLK